MSFTFCHVILLVMKTSITKLLTLISGAPKPYTTIIFKSYYFQENNDFYTFTKLSNPTVHVCFMKRILICTLKLSNIQ